MMIRKMKIKINKIMIKTLKKILNNKFIKNKK